MGRRPSKPDAIPRFRARRQKSGRVCYYYDHGIVNGRRREEPLGCDYGLAIKRWAELEHAAEVPRPAILTFRYVAERYMAEVASTKAPRTLRDNRKEVGRLLEFFDDPPCPLDAIRPQNVRQYLAWRGKQAKVRANREKALLSHIWNWARELGYTDKPNPCAGVRGYKERGRDVYIEEAEFRRLWEHADPVLRDAMDLAYLTGQRPADVLRMSEMDIRDGVLHVRQQKTGALLRIAVEGELATVVDRIRARKSAYRVYSTLLVVNEHGRAIGVHAISERFKRARRLAGLPHLQFRDIRAKAATDKAERTGDVRQAQRQLGHATVLMTEHYVRKRRGEKVTPTR